MGSNPTGPTNRASRAQRSSPRYFRIQFAPNLSTNSRAHAEFEYVLKSEKSCVNSTAASRAYPKNLLNIALVLSALTAAFHLYIGLQIYGIPLGVPLVLVALVYLGRIGLGSRKQSPRPLAQNTRLLDDNCHCPLGIIRSHQRPLTPISSSPT